MSGVTEVQAVADEEYTRVTPQMVGFGVAGGALGMAAMLPITYVAVLLDTFDPALFDALASFWAIVGIEPTQLLGAAVFAAGGIVVLPLLFISLGGFLPPENSTTLRGVVFATAVWPGFVIPFWVSGGQTGDFALFLVLTLIAHWSYGVVLGGIVGRFAGVPRYDV